MMIPVSPYGMTLDQARASVAKTMQANRDLVSAVGLFLQSAFPNVPGAVVDDLEDKALAYLNGPLEQYIDSIANMPAPAPFDYQGELARNLDDARGRLATAERGLDAMPEEMRDLMEATLVAPLREEVARLERRVEQSMDQS